MCLQDLAKELTDLLQLTSDSGKKILADLSEVILGN